MRDTKSLMLQVHDSGVDEEAFRVAMALYVGRIDTYGSALDDLKKMQQESGCKDMKEFYSLVMGEDPENLVDRTDESLEEEYCAGIIEARTPQLTMAGIQSAWRDNASINRGDQDFIVSITNPLNPYDDTGRESLINMHAVTQDQLQDKLSYAFEKRPDKAFALVLGKGVHWVTLAVDPVSKSYKYYDSYGTDMPEDFRQKLKLALPEGYTEIPHNEVTQQNDAVNCGLWVIKNCQHIMEDGNLMGVHHQKDSAREKEAIITELRQCAMEGWTTKILASLKDEAVLEPEIAASFLQNPTHRMKESLDTITYEKDKDADEAVKQGITTGPSNH